MMMTRVDDGEKDSWMNVVLLYIFVKIECVYAFVYNEDEFYIYFNVCVCVCESVVIISERDDARASHPKCGVYLQAKPI